MIPLTGLNDKHLLNTLAENRNTCYLGQTQQDPFRKALHLKIIFILLVSDPTHTKCIHLLVIMQHVRRGKKRIEKHSFNKKAFWEWRGQELSTYRLKGKTFQSPYLLCLSVFYYVSSYYLIHLSIYCMQKLGTLQQGLSLLYAHTAYNNAKLWFPSEWIFKRSNWQLMCEIQPVQIFPFSLLHNHSGRREMAA